MKQLLKFSLIGLLTVCLFSCDLDDNDDGYSLGNFWVSFGLVNFDGGDSNDFTITLDDGSELFPVNQFYIHDLKDSLRVLVNYTIVGDKHIGDDGEQYYAKINEVSKILFKGILDITPEIEDSIGNDPVHVEDVWKKDNMLTFELKFYGNGSTHFINLVKQPGELTGEDQPVALELRHNDNNDQPVYRMSAYVTFDLSAIKIAGQDSTTFVISGDDYNDESFNYEGVYHY